mmetsp:Transcript_112589/g.268344  ORF Transcript_112589/g.268344 Transcript_112589/m.268344 type:complete len:264 (+) Transcript_112589:338-1129(+)
MRVSACLIVLAAREDPKLMILVFGLFEGTPQALAERLGRCGIFILLHLWLRKVSQADILVGMALGKGSLLILLEVPHIDLGAFTGLQTLYMLKCLRSCVQEILSILHGLIEECGDGQAHQVIVVRLLILEVSPPLGVLELLQQLDHLFPALLLDVQFAGVDLTIKAHLGSHVISLPGQPCDQFLFLGCSEGPFLDDHRLTKVCHCSRVAAVKDADSLATLWKRIVELVMNLRVEDDCFWPRLVKAVQGADAVGWHSLLVHRIL